MLVQSNEPDPNIYYRTESLELDEKIFSGIVKDEIDRINAKRSIAASKQKPTP